MFHSIDSVELNVGAADYVGRCGSDGGCGKVIWVSRGNSLVASLSVVGEIAAPCGNPLRRFGQGSRKKSS